MKKIFVSIILAISITLTTSACGVINEWLKPSMPTVPPSQATISMMTHDSFTASDTVIYDFEKEHSVTLNFIRSGDTGAALNQAILSKDAPMADVLYGVDNTFLSRALDEDIFEPYDSPVLVNILDEFKLDQQNRVLPVDFADVCINYDKAYFKENNLAVPQSLEELIKPEYKGLLVVENPATSSPGLAFMLATIVHYGPDGYLNYWRDLRANSVIVANDWETAYYTNFSGSSGKGAQPMAVSYASSPAAEVYFDTSPEEESPTGSIIGPDTCFRQVEFVGILKGTSQRQLAEIWIDYMLNWRFQEDMPLQMFVYPVNGQARLPELFLKFAQITSQPANMDATTIAANRDQWIEAWNEVVLK